MTGLSRLQLALCAMLSLAAIPAAGLVDTGCGEGGCNPPLPEEPEPPKPTPRMINGNDRVGTLSSAGGSAIAPSGGPEYVMAGAANEVAAAAAAAVARGASVLREERLGSIGVSMAVLDLAGQMSADDLRRLLRENGLRVTLARNSTYQMADSARVYAGAMIGADLGRPCVLSAPVLIGLVDGPVDQDSAALMGVDILSHSVLDEGEKPATPEHATALAGLIASPGSGDFPAGVAPGAKLLSAVAFANRGGRNLAQMDRIAAALDWLAGQGVAIVNLSLAGPPNETLAYVLGGFADRGLILIAATGNDGADRVAFPASDPNVLGVSAVDALARPYPMANRGAEVDFVAPGVEVLVDEGRKRGYRSGTSYASAIATGVVAHLFAGGRRPAADILDRLRSDAKDLGAPGFDSRFGWGLMQLTGCTK